jgi:hypothetical protein
MKPWHFRVSTSVCTHLRRACCGLLAAAALMAPALATELPADGLVPTKAKNFDKAWQKPGADLQRYSAVLIRPATVAFSKHWRPRDYGSFGLKPDDVERIRSTYATAADQAFARELSKDGHQVVTAPGEHVLEVQVEVLELHVNGPEASSDVLTRTYVRNAGNMRLVLTLRDSATGTVLFRGSDFRRGDETGRLEWASSVYNRVEAERAFIGWARQLKGFLDQ